MALKTRAACEAGRAKVTPFAGDNGADVRQNRANDWQCAAGESQAFAGDNQADVRQNGC